MIKSLIENTLEIIIDNPDIHARWLNTLSYLEHIGSRKIIKTQSSVHTDENTLRHAAEEARHAYQFKKMIEKIGKEAENYSYDSLLCGFSANRYFQSLDAMVKKRMKTKKNFSRICYLYVTALIEERAGWLYPLYQKSLLRKNSPIDLSGIIKEEERHLAEMHDGLGELEEEIMIEFRKQEEIYFDRYHQSLLKYLRSLRMVEV